jgi:hypothetical protein
MKEPTAFDTWFDRWLEETILPLYFNRWSMAAIAQKLYAEDKLKEPMRIAWNQSETQRTK